MDLDNVIYIIALVVIFAFSLLGQNKKRKEQAPAENNNDEIIYSLNDFEKILERKKEFRKNEPEIVPPEIAEEKNKDTEHAGKKHIIEEKHSTGNKSLKTENENNDGFDVKSAIVYSSILERKKFRR